MIFLFSFLKTNCMQIMWLFVSSTLYLKKTCNWKAAANSAGESRNLVLLKWALLPHVYSWLPACCGCVEALWFCNQEPHYADGAQKRCLHATFLKTENTSTAGPHHSVIFPICRAPNSIRELCKVAHANKKKAVWGNRVKWLKHCLWTERSTLMCVTNTSGAQTSL